jgi:hypothetical protein
MNWATLPMAALAARRAQTPRRTRMARSGALAAAWVAARVELPVWVGSPALAVQPVWAALQVAEARVAAAPVAAPAEVR